MSSVGELNEKMVAAIDAKAINSLCLDIQALAEAIKKNLNDVNDLIDCSNSCYSGDTRSVFNDKKNNLMFSRENIINNGLSYIDDYNLVISRFKNVDVSLTLSNKING